MTLAQPKKNLTAQQPTFYEQETTDSNGAILDQHGSEIVITENMILEACEELHQEWGSVFRPRNTNKPE